MNKDTENIGEKYGEILMINISWNDIVNLRNSVKSVMQPIFVDL